jgi:NAD(P)-dependent dehydrogenase (short-subunit alcohol dehydrogenase family)
MMEGGSVKNVVITGSTRGIGYGLADAFLALDCAVVVSGRAQQNVDEAVLRLSSQHGTERVLGRACDVRHVEQVQALWDAAVARFGQVDIWVNNAGVSHLQADFWELAPEVIRAVVDTNLLGAMHGARVALRGMREQGSGSLYNVEGLGSDGRAVAGLSLYGTTKAAMRYLTDVLAAEMRDTDVIVGALQPGMVVTDLVTREREVNPETWERNRRIFCILCDRVETVTPWLVQRMLANRRNGARIKWLTAGKLALRFLTAPFRPRDPFG